MSPKANTIILSSSLLIACGEKQNLSLSASSSSNASEESMPTGTESSMQPTEKCAASEQASTWDSHSDGDEGNSTSVSTDGTCMNHSVVDDCCCFSDEIYPQTGCPEPFPCGEIVLFCEDVSGSVCPPSQLSAPCNSLLALDCALKTLRDGQPSGIRWRMENLTLPGYSGASGQLYIVGDGTAISVSSTYEDAPAEFISDTERRMLKPASFFDECLATTALSSRFNCILDAQTGGVIEFCAEGYIKQ